MPSIPFLEFCARNNIVPSADVHKTYRIASIERPYIHEAESERTNALITKLRTDKNALPEKRSTYIPTGGVLA